MMNITRRNIVTNVIGAASLSALPVAATASAMVADPIYAAIERHKVSNAALSRVLDGLADCERRHDEGSPELAEWERREAEAGNVEQDACDKMIDTVPTTFAGLLTLLRYVEQARVLDESGLKDLLSTTVVALASIEGVT